CGNSFHHLHGQRAGEHKNLVRGAADEESKFAELRRRKILVGVKKVTGNGVKELVTTQELRVIQGASHRCPEGEHLSSANLPAPSEAALQKGHDLLGNN